MGLASAAIKTRSVQKPLKDVLVGAFVLETTMSKKISELKSWNPGVIIGDHRRNSMESDPQYTKHLENLVQKMLPVYNRYYDLVGIPKPPLEEYVVERVLQKVPALFKPK